MSSKYPNCDQSPKKIYNRTHLKNASVRGPPSITGDFDNFPLNLC